MVDQKTRATLLKTGGGACASCGRRGVLELDHIIARAHGDRTTLQIFDEFVDPSTHGKAPVPFETIKAEEVTTLE